MKIYTVVGEMDHEGMAWVGPSFIGKSNAYKFKIACDAYDNTKPTNKHDSVYEEWERVHPVNFKFDGYDVVEHELVGVEL